MQKHLIKPWLILTFGLFSLHSCSVTSNDEDVPGQVLEKEFINPHNGYSEAVAVTSGATKTIHISGQVGSGNNLEEQMRSAIANLESVLKTTGASMKDVVKMNTYIVDYEPEQLDVFRRVRKELMGDEKMPASTLVGVESLALEEWLIEIEAIAVIQLSKD